MSSSIHRRLIAVVSIMLLGLFALAGCSSGGSSSAASSASGSSASSSAASSGTSAASSNSGAPASGSTVVMALDGAAGGEWSYSVQPEGVLSFVEQRAASAADGTSQQKFEFRAATAGEALVTFTLAGSGKTQVYAYTVTDDHNIILNPYKSNFDHEPEWPKSA